MTDKDEQQGTSVPDVESELHRLRGTTPPPPLPPVDEMTPTDHLEAIRRQQGH